MMGLRLADFEAAKANKKRYAQFLSSVVYIVVLVPFQTRNFRTAESWQWRPFQRHQGVFDCLSLTSFNWPSAVKS
jgi:hypothetical protein